jgi:hypothetical protein
MPSTLLLATLLAAPSAAPPCARFEADTVALTGRLERRVYPGRPRYESVATGDAPDTVFVLRLTRPLCGRASATDTAHAVIREVQLELPRGEAAVAIAQLGHQVTLHGTVQEWEWGWHHLPVLLRTSFGGSGRARLRSRAA